MTEGSCVAGGTCMAGCVCAGDMVPEVDGMHPTRMHSRLSLKMLLICDKSYGLIDFLVPAQCIFCCLLHHYKFLWVILVCLLFVHGPDYQSLLGSLDYAYVF